MADVSKAIIDTLIAEAGGEGQESMRRVAETILNRSAIRGLSPEQVVTQPYQYTGYSNPGPLARQAQNNPSVRTAAEAAWQLAMEPGDPTGGADHYFNPNVVQPSWARSMTPTGSYGGHNYYASRPIPPGEIPNMVGTALSTVPAPRIAPNPVTISPDLTLMRNPNMSSSAQQAQVTRHISAGAGSPIADNMAITGRTNPVTPWLTPQGAASYAPVDFVPTTTARGLGSLTPDAVPPPYPQSMSPQIASLRARDQDLQMMLNQRYPPTRLPPLPPSGQNNAALTNSAARRAALLANQSSVERNPSRPPQSYAGQERSPNLRNSRLVTAPIVQPTSVALNQAPIRVVNPVRQAPVPVMASSALQASRLAPRPAAAAPLVAQAALPVQTRAPLRVVVNGAGSYNAVPQPQPMTAVQQYQSQGLSPSQAYALANAANHVLSVEDRVRGSSGGSSASSISSW